MTEQIVNITAPYDGQQLIDASRTLWEFDASIQCWKRIGPVDNIPPADSVTTGLLAAAFKQMLDKIPKNGGAFNIVTKPFMSLKSPTNPDGLLRDTINLVSDSMNIACVDQKGKPITKPCPPCTHADSTFPAITFKLTEDFLKTLCVQTTTAPGPKGEKGAKGAKGADGTGDGPQGDQGDTGKDAAGAVKFSAIELVDADAVYDTAVTAAELDQEAGKLAVTKTKVRAPDSTTPATHLITTRIERGIAFTRGFEYTIQKPAVDTTDADLTLLAYPKGFEPTGSRSTPLNAVKLSEFIDMVIADYEGRFAKIDEDYSRQVKEFILEKDAAARDALNELACKLTEAEWNLPIENCIGFAPGDCHETGDVNGTLFPLAGDLLGPPYCTESLMMDLGKFAVPAGGETYVTESPAGGTTLPTGAYIITYSGGSYNDPVTTQDDGTYIVRDVNGNIVSTNPVPTSYTKGRYVNPDLVVISGGTTYVFPAPNRPVICKSEPELREAYRISTFDHRTVTLRLSEPGTILLRSTAPLTNGFPIDSVILRVFRVTQCPPEEGSTGGS
jgi:hypothetical protein